MATERPTEENPEERVVLITGKKHSLDDTEHIAVSGIPVDRGWAWMILLATSTGLFIFDAVARSAGIFFLQFQEKYGSSASETTLIQTFFSIFSSVSGVFLMALWLPRMSVRTSICIGGVLVAASYCISAYSEHFEVLIFALGAVAGVSWTMIYLPILSIIAIYFDKHRGLANSITAASSSVALLTIGPLFTIMFDHYGFQGTMLITSGFLLNIIPVGCIMRPPDFYAKPKAKKPLRANKRANLVDVEVKKVDTSTLTSNANENNTMCRFSDTSNDPTANSETNIHYSDIASNVSVKIRNKPSTTAQEGFKATEKDANEQNAHSALKYFSFLTSIFDMVLLKDYAFIHYIMFASISIISPMMTPLFCIPFAKDIGISNQRIGILIFVMGCMELVGRTIAGILADRKILQPTTMIASTYIIMAVINNLTRLVKGFWTLLAFVVIQVFLSGVYMPLYAVILIEHVGQSRFESALGFTNMAHGASLAAFFPLTGMLRDVTGSYYWTFHLLSVLLIIGAIMALTLPMSYKKCRNVIEEPPELK